MTNNDVKILLITCIRLWALLWMKILPFFFSFFSFAHLDNKKQKNIILTFRNQSKNQLFVADKRDVIEKGLRQSWKLGKTEAANLIKDLLYNSTSNSSDQSGGRYGCQQRRWWLVIRCN